jgi:uncharacterized membrane protein
VSTSCCQQTLHYGATLTTVKTFGRDGPIAARAGTAAVIGAVVAVSVGITTKWSYAPAWGWISAAAVFLAWTWAVIAKMAPPRTKSHATREDPTRVVTDIVILTASIASLLGVASLFTAASVHGAQADLAGLVGIASVAAAWCMVHTVFTLRYALLYYTGSEGGIDFNQSEAPAYADFAYLAFTIGMTYQVSDTDLKTRAIRATALRQGLLSYLLGAVVLAVAVNLVAGLAK